MLYPVPAESADLNEVRRHPKGSTNDLLIRRGVLAKLENNGSISIQALTGANYPTSALLSGVTNLYGIVTKNAVGVGDPVSEQSQSYGGQQVPTTEYAHVALISGHREIILPTINGSTGELQVNDAVPANIGRGVTIKAQNYSITIGGTKYWCFAGAQVNDGSDGIIVGIAGKGKVIVRLKRSFFAELQ